MGNEQKIMVRKNGEYQVSTKSQHFLKKYGVEQPLIIIEDLDKNVFGHKWSQIMNNPAVVAFMLRIMIDNLEEKITTDRAYYGKVYPNGKESYGIGELVFESELSKI